MSIAEESEVAPQPSEEVKSRRRDWKKLVTAVKMRSEA